MTLTGAARDESGTTLVELMVGLMMGMVILSALTLVIVVTLHGSARVSARVEATQNGRITLTKITEELHSACIYPKATPIEEGSTATTLRFVHAAGGEGGEVAPNPVRTEISLSEGTLTQYDYAMTGGSALAPSFSSTPTTTQLMTDVAPIPSHSGIFTYYKYLNGNLQELSASPSARRPGRGNDRGAGRAQYRTALDPGRRRRFQRQPPGQRRAAPHPALVQRKRDRPAMPVRIVRERWQRVLGRGEEGFTMIMTVLGLALVAMLTAVAVTAVQGDSHVSYRDFTRKQAYEAAKAGIDEYAFHLHEDTAYWAKCTDVAKPTALNQEGSTANRRTVPGSTTASYALELIPATGYTSCDSSSVAAATASMLESQGTMKGTFRVKSTGYAGDSEVSITATFKPASFLDYVYFTQLETSDPVTYGDEQTIKGAYEQCSKTIAEGRYDAYIPNSGYQKCDVISFVSGDNIKGPMHTNDAFVICSSPTLGRSANDPVEVSSPPQRLVLDQRTLGIQLHRQPQLRRHLHDQLAGAAAALDQRARSRP